jgi:predicted AAA+ superfamily ATPase
MKSVFIDQILSQRERFEAPTCRRATMPELGLNKVQTIVGPRRAGKSSVLKLSIKQLLDSGVGWDKICYLSLEDERLRAEPFDPDLILQAFAEVYPNNPLLEGVYFMFDEVQYLSNWEPFVNRVYEQVSKKVFITGSNSKLLHTEVAGVLRGRGLPTEILPLSFSEYLIWKGIPFEAAGPGKAPVVAAFKSYLNHGGFPEAVDLQEHTRNKLMQEYFNAVLFLDIIDQQQPANYAYLRYLFHRIAANTGKPTGLRKIFLELKSRGYAIAQGSIYNMADAAESVYLFKRIAKFDHSAIKRENADKKCYFIDNGMLKALNSSFSNNLGALFENLVFWELYRQCGNIYTTGIYYYKDQSHECDFILYEDGGQALPVQACADINSDETLRREVKGLIKACEIVKSKVGIIITPEEEKTIAAGNTQIHVIPAWKWFGAPFDLRNLS